MKPVQHMQEIENTMEAMLEWDAQKREFHTKDVESQVNFGTRSIFGIHYTEGSGTSFSHITLHFPEHCMAEGTTLTIGAGDKAEVRAYLGSTAIGRSGWATGGEITISRWDETTREFSASFQFAIKHTMGIVEVMKGTVHMSLADDTRSNRIDNGVVQAELAPAIFDELGNLNATQIKIVDLADGRFRLSATQEGQGARQGIHLFFGQESARLFYIIDKGVYDMLGGNIQHYWDESAQRLTASFTDFEITFQGKKHRITNGSIDVKRA
ncbi:hypothetical protein D3C80_1225370 [compost metagenome]